MLNEMNMTQQALSIKIYEESGFCIDQARLNKIKNQTDSTMPSITEIAAFAKAFGVTVDHFINHKFPSKEEIKLQINQDIDTTIFSQKYSKIKIMVVSGRWLAEGLLKYIKQMLTTNKSCTSQFLLARPHSTFVNNIERIQKEPDDISKEIIKTSAKIELLKNEFDKRIETRYFNTEYRSNLFIFDNDYIWINIPFVPYEHITSTKMLSLEINNTTDESQSLIRNCNDHFDAIWKVSHETYSKTRDYFDDLLRNNFFEEDYNKLNIAKEEIEKINSLINDIINGQA
jgi:transcriptional regulator with XRE-family HTH domain